MSGSTREILFALASGTLFGAGLAVSGMTDPGKVLAFLDIAGRWDPSLALVMASALIVSATAVRIEARRTSEGRTVVAASAKRAGLDARLLVGSCLFGLGWGLGGLCPGPALASLVTGSPGIGSFVASMVVGMGLFEAWTVWRSPHVPDPGSMSLAQGSSAGGDARLEEDR